MSKKSSDDENIWSAYTATVKRTKKSTTTKSAPRRPASPVHTPNRHADENRHPEISEFKNRRSQFWPKAPLDPDLRRDDVQTKTSAQKLDRATEKKLRQGTIEIDATLDLHGLKQDEAYEALKRFIFSASRLLCAPSARSALEARSARAGALEARNRDCDGTGQAAPRTLLIITGKGRAGVSVLRENLPRWCEASPLAEKILALRVAAPQHGGAGAFYVILRRV